MLSFVIPGPPMPQERGRKGPHGWYIPRKSLAWRKTVAWAARSAILAYGHGGAWPLDARLYRVKVDCYFPDRRTRDAINVACNLLDALGGQRAKRKGARPRPAVPGILWDNDKRCAPTATPHVDRANPRTVVSVEVLA